MSAQTFQGQQSAPLSSVVCSGIVSKGTAGIVGNLNIVSPLISPPDTAPTSWTFWDGAYNGGGLQPDHLQIYQYTTAPNVGNPTAQLVDAYLANTTTAAGPPAVVSRSFPVWRANASRPINDSAPWIGSFTCDAATPVVVACASIPDASRVRIFLLGGSAAAFTSAAAAGVAAPAITIQPNASFTATGGTTGLIYGYEVLAA